MTKRAQTGPLGESVAAAVARRRSDPKYAELEQRYQQSMAIADLVVLHRTRRGMTQSELARLMRTSETAVARLESGFHLPSTETLRRLAAALGGRLTIGIEFAQDEAPRRRSRAKV